MSFLPDFVTSTSTAIYLTRVQAPQKPIAMRGRHRKIENRNGWKNLAGIWEEGELMNANRVDPVFKIMIDWGDTRPEWPEIAMSNNEVKFYWHVWTK